MRVREHSSRNALSRSHEKAADNCILSGCRMWKTEVGSLYWQIGTLRSMKQEACSDLSCWMSLPVSRAEILNDIKWYGGPVIVSSVPLGDVSHSPFKRHFLLHFNLSDYLLTLLLKLIFHSFSTHLFSVTKDSFSKDSYVN